jgi:hypothetical protein
MHTQEERHLWVIQTARGSEKNSSRWQHRPPSESNGHLPIHSHLWTGEGERGLRRVGDRERFLDRERLCVSKVYE